MKSFLIPFFLGLGLFASADLHAHGGRYKGPEDTTPPGGSGIPTPPTPPNAPSTPSKPSDPSTPSTPGTSGVPTPPNQPPARQPSGPPTGTGGGALPLSDHTGWQYWWEFNKEGFLNLRARVQSPAPSTEGASILTGLTGAGARTASLVSEQAVRDRILPALHAAARSADEVDVLTGSMIAIARIGRDADGSAATLFAEHLGAPSQEVAETAAICFGILKDPAALQSVIPALIFDQAAGRTLVGEGEVPARTRVFAAYAAGLIGGAASDEKVRALVGEMLLSLLETDRSPYADLRVAAVLGLGLLEPQDPELVDRLVSRLGARLDQGQDDALVLAHHPATIAKLLRASPAGFPARERALDQMLRLAQPRADAHGLVRQSAVLALGMLARPHDPRSAEIHAALAEVQERGRDLLAKNFTAIAMAYLGAAAPDYDCAENGLPVTRFLLDGLRRSNTSYEAWCALALGVQAFLRQEQGMESPSIIAESVMKKFSGARAPDLLGACAISLGLMRQRDAAPDIAARMDRIGDASFRGYAAVALGLLGDSAQSPRLLTLLQEERRDPDLLRQAATGLGLIGNPELRVALLELLAPSDGARASLPVLAAAAIAIGFVGDGRAVEPLLGLLEDARRLAMARAFSAIALGLLADKEWLPWNAALGADLNYGAAVSTLIEKSSANGILDLL